MCTPYNHGFEWDRKDNASPPPPNTRCSCGKLTYSAYKALLRTVQLPVPAYLK